MSAALSEKSALRRIVETYPALLRVGFVGALAYRAEILIWILTTNLPLVNLALWSAVARDAPVGRWDQADFIAYFLGVLVVRLLTGCALVWELTMEIRQGTLAMRLLRPIHPLLAHSAENLARVPLRLVLVAPIALALYFIAGPEQLASDPLLWTALPFTLIGAWLMVFLVMAIVGTLALWVESASSLYEVWLGLYTVFSGYLVPLELFPEWLQRITWWLPFRLMLGFPVDTLLGRLGREDLAQGLALQAAYLVALSLILRFIWRAGMRRHAAFGG